MMTAAHQSALLGQFNFEGPDKIRVQATSTTEQLLREAGIPRTVRFEFYAVEVKRTKLGFWALKNHPDPGEGEPENVIATITPPTVPPVRPFIEPRDPGEEAERLSAETGGIPRAWNDPMASAEDELLVRREIIGDEMGGSEFINIGKSLKFTNPHGANIVFAGGSMDLGGDSERRFLIVGELGDEVPRAGNAAPTRVFEVPIDGGNRLRLAITGEVNLALPAPQEPEQWQPAAPSDLHIVAALHALYACGLPHYEVP